VTLVFAPTATASSSVERLVLSGGTERQRAPRYHFSAPSFSPIQLTLFGKIAPAWQFRQPLLVTIEQDTDGSFLASEVLFATYGVGQTPRDALMDFVIALLDYYEIVAAHARQDEYSCRLLRRLQEYLYPIEDDQAGHVTQA